MRRSSGYQPRSITLPLTPSDRRPTPGGDDPATPAGEESSQPVTEVTEPAEPVEAVAENVADGADEDEPDPDEPVVEAVEDEAFEVEPVPEDVTEEPVDDEPADEEPVDDAQVDDAQVDDAPAPENAADAEAVEAAVPVDGRVAVEGDPPEDDAQQHRDLDTDQGESVPLDADDAAVKDEAHQDDPVPGDLTDEPVDEEPVDDAPAPENAADAEAVEAAVPVDGPAAVRGDPPEDDAQQHRDLDTDQGEPVPLDADDEAVKDEPVEDEPVEDLAQHEPNPDADRDLAEQDGRQPWDADEDEPLSFEDEPVEDDEEDELADDLAQEPPAPGVLPGVATVGSPLEPSSATTRDLDVDQDLFSYLLAHGAPPPSISRRDVLVLVLAALLAAVLAFGVILRLER